MTGIINSTGAKSGIIGTTVGSFDDDRIQTNIALVAFKTAVNGSLAKYDLQDQIVDEYGSAAGIDGTPSDNHILTAGYYHGVSTITVSSEGTSAQSTTGLYTYYVWTVVGGTRTFTNSAALNIDYLVVAGGGGGGYYYSGGGGAGGFKTAANYSLSAAAPHAISVGASGGASSGASGSAAGLGGTGGNSSIAALIVSTGGGGGGPGDYAFSGVEGQGGSGGGGGGANKPGASASPADGQGNDGGDGVNISNSNDGGGGGGAAAAGSNAGVGGAGENEIMGMDATLSDAFLTTLSLGVDEADGLRYFSGGGGGGGYAPSGGTGNVGGVGGGGAGSTGGGTAGTPNTGGGGGGSGLSGGAAGGTGIVIIRHLTSALSVYENITLQSTDTTAEAVPTKADMVMLMEDTAGTATLNTDIKGFVSRDSGSTFIEGTLVDEGHWGIGPSLATKRILAFHDLSFTGASGTAMCYKITTHNQSASKDTRIHATSIGWR